MSPDLLPLSEVCRRVPGHRGSQHVTTTTLTRWIVTGCRAQDGERVLLPATRAGYRWLVSPADLDAFFVRLARPVAGAAVSTEEVIRG